jgi:hypothetical protein
VAIRKRQSVVTAVPVVEDVHGRVHATGPVVADRTDLLDRPPVPRRDDEVVGGLRRPLGVTPERGVRDRAAFGIRVRAVDQDGRRRDRPEHRARHEDDGRGHRRHERDDDPEDGGAREHEAPARSPREPPGARRALRTRDEDRLRLCHRISLPGPVAPPVG